MSKTTYLTKSKFTHCLEWPIKLYYKSHTDEYVSAQDDNDFLQALAEGDIQVSELAKLYIPAAPKFPTPAINPLRLSKRENYCNRMRWSFMKQLSDTGWPMLWSVNKTINNRYMIVKKSSFLYSYPLTI